MARIFPACHRGCFIFLICQGGSRSEFWTSIPEGKPGQTSTNSLWEKEQAERGSWTWSLSWWLSVLAFFHTYMHKESENTCILVADGEASNFRRSSDGTGGYLASTEYLPLSGSWCRGPPLLVPRASAAAAELRTEMALEHWPLQQQGDITWHYYIAMSFVLFTFVYIKFIIGIQRVKYGKIC